MLLSGFAGFRWGALAFAGLMPLVLMSDRPRFVGLAIAVGFVIFFESVVMDRVLFVVWPEAGFRSFLINHVF